MAALAEDLGLAKSTVSRALSGSRQVSAETTKLVRQRAAELGYAVHPHLRTLMSRQRRKLGAGGLETIAFVNDYESEEDFLKYLNVQAIFTEAKSQAASIGCRVEWIPLRKYDVDGSKLRRELVARGILGIILGPTRDIDLPIPAWMEEFAIVACGGYWENEQVDRVRTDGRDAYLKLVSSLDERGCTRVGTCYPARMRTPNRGISQMMTSLRSWGELVLIDLGESLGDPDFVLARAELSQLDGLIFHGSENAQIAADFLAAYPDRLVLAEFSPRDIYAAPKWLVTVSPLDLIGRTLCNIIIEKIARSEWGCTACSRGIVFPSTIQSLD